MKTLKSLKSILLTGLAVIFLTVAFSSEASAWPRFKVYAGVPTVGALKVKPGPNYVWVEGHYKVNRHGQWIWVPGHWKRI